MKKLIAAAIFCLFLSVPAIAAEPHYTLLNEGGYVCVFEEGKLDNPSIRTDIFVDLLPQDDQRRLREGICVSGRSKLNAILEDFSS